MKGITLWQPWASAIACGVKTHETRSWKTRFRGPIAIHAAKHVPQKIRDDAKYWLLYQHVMDHLKDVIALPTPRKD